MLSRFHLIPERYGQTDRRTDRIAISISHISVLVRNKDRHKTDKDDVEPFFFNTSLLGLLSFQCFPLSLSTYFLCAVTHVIQLHCRLM